MVGYIGGNGAILTAMAEYRKPLSDWPFAQYMRFRSDAGNRTSGDGEVIKVSKLVTFFFGQGTVRHSTDGAKVRNEKSGRYEDALPTEGEWLSAHHFARHKQLSVRRWPAWQPES